MKKSNVKTKTCCMVLLLLICCLGQVFAAACGDVNSSGSIDVVDALIIAQYYVGLNPANFDPTIADVNADGNIDVVDALRVAQYYVGLVPELSCGTTNPDPVWSGGPYTLNGTSDYIDLPDGLTNNLGDFSIACWVYLNSRDSWSRVFDFGGSTDVFMMFTPASGDTGNPYFAITTSGNPGEQGINGTSAMPTGSWQHIAVVRSGDTGILYINGQEAGRNNSMTLMPADLGNTTNNYIGRSQWSNDPYLNADIAEFLVYDRGLSASEVTTLASNQPQDITPAPTPVGETPTPTPGPNGGPNSMGYCGCSMAENVANGYRTVGGQRMWGGYGTSGMVVQSWTDSNSSSWQLFDQQSAKYGKPTAIWVQVCIFPQGATYDEVKQMIAAARQHVADGATIYITGQPLYPEGNVCTLAGGADGPPSTDRLAQQAGNDASQNVIYSGTFTLRNSEVADGCHANSAGEQALGNQAVQKWGK
ncbi:MAG: hypothetical protein JXB88_24800 [Spirochaetales bacterium]|nr:hypothetical protein [Spirochaetales bacterium]